jgi:hypothetical protein
MFPLISNITLKVLVLRLANTQTAATSGSRANLAASQPINPPASHPGSSFRPHKQPTNQPATKQSPPILLQLVFYIQLQTRRWSNSSLGGEWHCNKRNLQLLFSDDKHLKKSNYATFCPHSLLQLGRGQTQPADYLTQLCLCQVLIGFPCNCMKPRWMRHKSPMY